MPVENSGVGAERTSERNRTKAIEIITNAMIALVKIEMIRLDAIEQ